MGVITLIDGTEKEIFFSCAAYKKILELGTESQTLEKLRAFDLDIIEKLLIIATKDEQIFDKINMNQIYFSAECIAKSLNVLMPKELEEKIKELAEKELATITANK